MVDVKNDTEQILAGIAELQAQLPQVEGGVDGSGFLLREYLDNLTSYAETAYAESVHESEWEDDTRSQASANAVNEPEISKSFAPIHGYSPSLSEWRSGLAVPAAQLPSKPLGQDDPRIYSEITPTFDAMFARSPVQGYSEPVAKRILARERLSRTPGSLSHPRNRSSPVASANAQIPPPPMIPPPPVGPRQQMFNSNVQLPPPPMIPPPPVGPRQQMFNSNVQLPPPPMIPPPPVGPQQQMFNPNMQQQPRQQEWPLQFHPSYEGFTLVCLAQSLVTYRPT
jgi:hypothetical protein